MVALGSPVSPSQRAVMSVIDYDLRVLIEQLVHENAQIDSIHIFGSRAYETQSLRSDCDLLIHTAEGTHLKPSTLREFAMEHCPAIDFFLVSGTKAVSVVNDSFVEAKSFADLVIRLDAISLWKRTEGFSSTRRNWVFQTSSFAFLFTQTFLGTVWRR
jgi:predicted nucleotidyltransferase